MAMKHVGRTHRIAIDWLFELCRHEFISLRSVNTKYQIADVFTKAVTKGDTWKMLTDLMQIRPDRSVSPSAIEFRKGLIAT